MINISVKGFKLSDGTVEKYDYSSLEDIVTDTTLALFGVAADAKKVGDEISDIKEDLSSDEARITALEQGSSGSGLTDDIKTALLQLAAKVAYIDDDGQDYYDDLEDALYPPAPPKTVSYINAVYTQSGVVYDTDTLDSLKSDLVVTAHYTDSTSGVVTNYNLSGTLTEGTSTITVSYGGKSTTFTVIVTVYTTSPSIAVEGVGYKSNGTSKNNAGSCYTDYYEYEIDTDAIKETQYYNSENNYVTTGGAIWELYYCCPNTNSISFAGYTAIIISDSSDTYIQGASQTFDGTEHFATDVRYKSEYFNLTDDKIRFRFTLPLADVENAYAYFTTSVSGVMPVGVTSGDIIFAGRNTPYYGKHNIND